MKKYFITYGDSNYENAKKRICNQAKKVNEFDEIIPYGREHLSKELKASKIINIKRGGGLWSWKPDIILSTIENAQIGDIIIYCDAGCSLYKSNEWTKIWNTLKHYDIIAQRIFQKNISWTRKEIIDYFRCNGKYWLYNFQYQATIILKVTEFTRDFIKEWRDIMIEHPEFVMDVPKQKIKEQLPGFIENRHDQAVYSALLYKYLNNVNFKNKIFTQWEHVEDYDPFFKQAIRATRLRHGENENFKRKILAVLKSIIKNYIFKPFYYVPINKWLDYKNDKYESSIISRWFWFKDI